MIESLVPAGSTYAWEIDYLFTMMFVVVGFWFFACEGMFFWLIWKFRAKDGQRAQHITGDEKRLHRWISIPHMLVLICDIFILVGAVKVWYDIKQDLPPAEKIVRVIGQQWTWTFVHPGSDGVLDTADDIYKVNELHLQKDVLYHYKLEAVDVLHDFSVPIFRLKQDAIPGRVITGWFEPTLEGEFDIQCAEICGIGHGLMAARVFVEGADEHAAWMDSETPLALAANSLLPPRIGEE
jgi:cytochrome c oxidase subunit 2